MAEVSPVDLGLLARQAAQAQIGLCRPAWPMTGNKVAEVIRTAAIAALAHHDEQTARRQFRELLQRRADERQIRLDLRSARWRAVLRQTGLRQYSHHRLVVHAQLPSDGTDAPLLDKVIA